MTMFRLLRLWFAPDTLERWSLQDCPAQQCLTLNYNIMSIVKIASKYCEHKGALIFGIAIIWMFLLGILLPYIETIFLKKLFGFLSSICVTFSCFMLMVAGLRSNKPAIAF